VEEDDRAAVRTLAKRERERTIGVVTLDDRPEIDREERRADRRGHGGGEVPLPGSTCTVDAHTQSFAAGDGAADRIGERTHALVSLRQRPVGAARIAVVAARGHQPAVERRLPEEQVGRLLVQRDHLGEQWAREVGPQIDQAVPNEGSVWSEVRAADDSLGGRRAQEVERQIDGGPPPGDVVLEIGVEPLVAKVDVRGESEDDDIQVERSQLVLLGQPDETRARHRCLVVPWLDLRAAEGRCARLPPEERLEIGLADVQTAKAVVGNMRAESGGHACRGPLQQAIQTAQRWE
jgi:hypothetical protein